ncbi:MAG: methyl-accepting chemotaxis protein [Pseudobdellovibrionaceae bacterium]|jgi:methyl-accepting chemotaxis protein|nr:methyl-accepting chemotaxis protein [Pseudobdellovibrionaceae bacterium]
MMFSLFSKSESSPPKNKVSAQLKQEEQLPSGPETADMEHLLKLLCEGKFDQALDICEQFGLTTSKDSVLKMKSRYQSDMERTVSLSVHINEASNYGAKLNRISQEINHRSQGMAAALEELSSSSSSIVDTVQSVGEYTSIMSSFVNEGIHSSRELGMANDQIADVVSETGAKVEELVASTEEIHRILKIISDISEKTKLLSLNATIEAARAGEAGKGFAVVASEVKGLAEQTATSADDIKQKVQALTDVTGKIASLMDDVAQAVGTGREKLDTSQTSITNIQENAERVSEQMREIMSIVRDQDAAVSEISSNVSEIATTTQESLDLVGHTLDSMDSSETDLVAAIAKFPDFELDHTTVNLAKSDHVIWKKKLSSMAAGRLHLDPGQLADHKSCRLGKWYYSDASKDYRNMKSFKDLEAAHIEVHKHGIQAAQKYNNNDVDGALKEIDVVEKSSIEVLTLLADMSK